MNILTFDIEEWYTEKVFHGNRPEKYKEYDLYLDKILELLANINVQGTFFCLGKMASDYPYVVKKIAAEGHEIACHSDKHCWLNKLSREELQEDTKRAVESLEQCVGKKILAYRAPAFSIGESNLYAFEVLAENGIVYDSSVFPAKRDFGGFSDFGSQQPCTLIYKGIEIKEFPIPMMTIAGKKTAYSGGGFFRFFPLQIIKRKMACDDYSMAYFHIGDLIPEYFGFMGRDEYETTFKEKGTYKNRLVRYIKSNIGVKSAYPKMVKLINSVEFVNIAKASNSIEWQNQPVIKV